jgi:hypothetical protein
MVGNSFRVLWLPPPLKLVRHDIAEILLKVAVNTKNQIKSNHRTTDVHPVHFMVFFCQRPRSRMMEITFSIFDQKLF